MRRWKKMKTAALLDLGPGSSTQTPSRPQTRGSEEQRGDEKIIG